MGARSTWNEGPGMMIVSVGGDVISFMVIVLFDDRGVANRSWCIGYETSECESSMYLSIGKKAFGFCSFYFFFFRRVRKQLRDIITHTTIVVLYTKSFHDSLLSCRVRTSSRKTFSKSHETIVRHERVTTNVFVVTHPV